MNEKLENPSGENINAANNDWKSLENYQPTEDQLALLDAMKHRDEDVQLRGDSYNRERAQELLERGLNDRMDISLEDIDAYSKTEGSEVIGYQTDYDGKTIQVYDLAGMPFRYIQHAIDYKSSMAQQEGTLGNEVSKQLKDDPSVWMNGLENTNGSNNLSVSYINLGNKVSRDHKIKTKCAYGWLSFPADSVINAGWTDLHSGQNEGNDPTKIDKSKVNLIDALDQPTEDMALGPYNEIVMRRFGENGKPRAPEFIISDGMNDLAKKHAAYYGVPIININKHDYDIKDSVKELSEKEQAGTISAEEKIDLDCKELLGEFFSNYEQSSLVNRYTGKTKAEEIKDALSDYERIKNLPISSLEFEDQNSVMYLEEIREKKEVEAWKARGKDINLGNIPNIYDAMTIDEKVTAGEYLKSIPQIIAKLGSEQ